MIMNSIGLFWEWGDGVLRLGFRGSSAGSNGGILMLSLLLLL